MHSDLEPRYILRETLLSRKPSRISFLVAFLSLDLIFVASQMHWHGVAWLAPAVPEKVFVDHEYWRLFTALLIHLDAQHLASNCLLFGVLSYLLYGYYGWLIYPVMSFLFGALTNYVSLLTYEPQTRLLGISGMIYWMAGCWVTLYFGIDRTHTLRHRFLRSLGFCLALLVPSSIEPNVSYRTHGIGFALGVTYGLLHFFVFRERFRRAERYEVEWPEGVDEIWH